MNTLIQKAKAYFRRDSLFYRICKCVYTLPRYYFSSHGYIRQYLIFPIEAFGRKHHIKPFYNANTQLLETLKGKHSGRRAFVIATGPSLKLEDVEKLDGEVTIGVNSLFKLYDKTGFRPTYYMVLDADVQTVVEKHIDDFQHMCKENMFMNPLRKVKHKGVNYIPLCYQNHWFNLGNDRFDYTKNLKYNDDLVWGFYDKYTITNVAIDLAIYMGCKDIYLIGVDCNYTGPKVHFDEIGDETPRVSYDIAYHTQKAMMAGYRFMERETKKRGIHIMNATRGGMLEEFDRVDFDTLF